MAERFRASIDCPFCPWPVSLTVEVSVVDGVRTLNQAELERAIHMHMRQHVDVEAA